MIGCEEADSDMSGHVEGELMYKVPLFLPLSPLQSETLTVLQ